MRRPSLLVAEASPRGDGHVLGREILHAVAGGEQILRGGQAQMAAGEHEHRLVDVVDCVVAPGLVGGGEDVHMAFAVKPVDFVIARIVQAAGSGLGRGRLRRRCRTGCHGLLAVMRDQGIRIHSHVATDGACLVMGGYGLVLLVPIDAAQGGDGHRAAMRQVERLARRRRGQEAGWEQNPEHRSPYRAPTGNSVSATHSTPVSPGP